MLKMALKEAGIQIPLHFYSYIVSTDYLEIGVIQYTEKNYWTELFDLTSTAYLNS